MTQRTFSQELARWLRGDQPKTVATLTETFGYKSFAILFLLLMALPAMPLPTGGITHVFEVVTMLVALELILGRDTIWVPRRWQNMSLAGTRSIPFIIKRVQTLEGWSRRRAGDTFGHPWFHRLFGLMVLLLALAAFVAPPFTGLDTLPSLGVVLVSLAAILEDAVLLAAGLGLGILGAALEASLGAGFYRLLS